MKKEASYLGDGAYVLDQGYDFKIFTSNGVEETNTVFLGDVEVKNLLHYIERSRNVKITMKSNDEMLDGIAL